MAVKKKKGANFFHALHTVFMPHKKNGRHPHILRYGAIIAVLAFVSVVEFAGVFQSLLLTHSTDQIGAVLPAVVVDLTNQQRSSNNLSALTPNTLLAEAAQNAANDMAANGYFAHVSPSGKTPWDWLNDVGYQYQYAGENLAVNFDDSQQLMDAWMNSASHKANILGQHFTQIGIGMATGTYQGQRVVFVVQFFASPRADPSVPQPTHITATKTQPRTIVSTPSVLGTSTPMSLAAKVSSSPHTYVDYTLLGLAAFFIVALIVNLIPFRGLLAHPKAFLNGFGILAILFAVILINQNVLFSKVFLPTDNQFAAVIFSIDGAR